MSNLNMIIEERPADIGNFLVGRLLPFKGKRTVGPFIFIDHMGPARMGADQHMDIGPHPHIGLSTLTYLFEGAVMHRDSLGTEMEIRPGAVNWMTAGRGIVHSERTPLSLRNTEKQLHGFQIWVALPKELEEIDPSFTHIDAGELPAWEQDGATFRLIAGEAFGRRSPVPVHSRLYFVEIKTKAQQPLHIGTDLYGEAGLYILEGSIRSEGHTFSPKQLLVAKNSQLCSFEAVAGTTLYLFGGEPFPEERFIYWNFVSSRRERIEKAKEDWRDDQFDPIPGEQDRVPLPPDAFRVRLS